VKPLHTLRYKLNAMDLLTVNFPELLEQSNEQLIELQDLKYYTQRGVVCSNHCLDLYDLLEKKTILCYKCPCELRSTGHSFNLPRYQYNLTGKSFVFRNL